MKKISRIFIISGLALSMLFAQGMPMEPGKKMGDNRKKMDDQPYYQYMVFRMTEELSLIPEQAEKLFPLNRPYQNAKHQVHMLMNELSEEVYSKDEISNEDLQSYKKTLRALKEREIKLDEDYYAEVETFLSAEQVAKLMFFEPYFRRELSHELKQRYMPGNEKKKEKKTFWKKQK